MIPPPTPILITTRARRVFVISSDRVCMCTIVVVQWWICTSNAISGRCCDVTGQARHRCQRRMEIDVSQQGFLHQRNFHVRDGRLSFRPLIWTILRRRIEIAPDRHRADLGKRRRCAQVAAASSSSLIMSTRPMPRLPRLIRSGARIGSGKGSSFMHAFSSMLVHFPLVPA